MEINIISVLLFLSGGFCLFLSLYALSMRRSALVHSFSLFAGAVSVYAFGYGAELLSQKLAPMLFWSKIQYLGIPFIPGLIILVAIYYTGRQQALSRFRLALIFTIPLITLIARLSNPYHFLFYRTAIVDFPGPGPMLNITPGPFYLVHVAYSNISWAVASFLLLRFFVRTAPSFRKQTLSMLIASSIQWVGYMIYLLGVVPDNLDLNPILLSLSLPVYALGIFKFYLFNLVPLARDTIFEEMKDAVIVVDPELRLVDCNKRSRSLLPEIFNKNSIGQNVKQLLSAHPDILDIFAMDMGRELEIPLEEKTQPLVFKLSLAPLFDREKRQIASILTFHDHTRQKKLMDALEKMATVDELTGIYNRRHLMFLSEIEMSRSQRNKNPLSLLLLDLDHFKLINDTWGHHFGDMVLKKFADTVKRNIRDIDIFGRYGGEEFLIVLPEIEKVKAMETAQRICRLIAEFPIFFEDQVIKLTVSIGVSGTWDLENPTVESLVQNADKALYTGKNQGRNRVVLSHHN